MELFIQEYTEMMKATEFLEIRGEVKDERERQEV